MAEIIRCRRCTLPESIPSVGLDEEGICNYCNRYERLFGDWEMVKAGRKKEFEKLVHWAKQQQGDYDCLVPLSGGKDSTYALWLCGKVYKLRCLCLTFDNGFMSEYARDNIEKALRIVGADHLLYAMDRHLLMKLYRLFLVRCGTFCPVCRRGVGIGTSIVLRSLKIPMIISGGGRRISSRYLAELNPDDNRAYFKNVLEKEHFAENISQLQLNPFPWNLKKVVATLYRTLRIPNPPGISRLIGLMDYIDVSPEELDETITKEMGWRSPPDRYEHMDCTASQVASYIFTLKFPDLTSDTVNLSGAVRMGSMTREDAMKVENEKLATSRVPRELEMVLEKLEMNKDEFEACTKDWKKMERFYGHKRRFIRSLYRKMIGAR